MLSFFSLDLKEITQPCSKTLELQITLHQWLGGPPLQIGVEEALSLEIVSHFHL